MTIRADKREVTKAASVLAKASWMRNAKRKAMVEDKKKREAKQKEHRQQVKKIQKDVTKRRVAKASGDRQKALPSTQKKKTNNDFETVPLARRKNKKKKNDSQPLNKRQFQGIYNLR